MNLLIPPLAGLRFPDRPDALPLNLIWHFETTSGKKMDKETDFYTGTMARVYADQGHWDKAAEIYRHLLKLEPERIDYLEALARAERKSNTEDNRPEKALAPLFHQWIDLMLRYKNLQKLRRLKK